jgi:hypothetical protein
MSKQLFLTGEEMFESLQGEDKLKYFNFIQVQDLKDFIIKCYEKAGKDINDTSYESLVCKILIDHLIRRGLLDTQAHQNFVDLLLTSAFLHNLYFNEEDMICSLLKARAELDEIAQEMNIPDQIREAIWQGVEEQLGDATPVKKLKPSPNTPQELLSECVFIARNIHRWS